MSDSVVRHIIGSVWSGWMNWWRTMLGASEVFGH